MDESDEFFATAGEANENGDRYQAASTTLAIVLFFAGISLVIDIPRLRTALLVAAAVILAVGGTYLASLPLA